MFFDHCEVCGTLSSAYDMEPTDTGYRHAACTPVVGFDRPEDGSQARYEKRRAERPWIAHQFWWVVHNLVAHPLIAVAPRKPCFDFHDWTSRKMHGL